MEDQCYWVYIIRCDNNTYYTGYTNDLAKRYQSHISGTGKCKYTRSFKPITLEQSWKIIGSKGLAMQIERQIKKLSRIEKEKIILEPSLLLVNPGVHLMNDKELFLYSAIFETSLRDV